VIDLHLHLLPGVDDGPETLEAALAMCRIAAADGCTALVATPHQRRDEWPTGDGELLERARAELEGAAGGAPRLFLGGEVRVDSEILRDLDAPGRAGTRTLAGSRYLLLEFEPRGIGPEPVGLVREILARGLVPIVAHAEVTPCFWMDDDDVLTRMVEAGGHLQVTGASVCGDFGRVARDRAWALLDAGLVDFLASDAHRPDWRPPGMSRARALLASRLGESAAERLTREHPSDVLADRPLSAPAAEASA
jgi:protein-tyrosine phosphatase